MGDSSVTAGNQPSALDEVTELWNVDRRDIKVWESRRGGSQRFDSVKKEYVTAEVDSITQEDPWWMVKCLMNCLRDSCRVSGCHIYFLDPAQLGPENSLNESLKNIHIYTVHVHKFEMRNLCGFKVTSCVSQVYVDHPGRWENDIQDGLHLLHHQQVLWTLPSQISTLRNKHPSCPLLIAGINEKSEKVFQPRASHFLPYLLKHDGPMKWPRSKICVYFAGPMRRSCLVIGLFSGIYSQAEFSHCCQKRKLSPTA